MEVVNNEVLDQYKMYVENMVVFLAELQKYADKVRKGEDIDRVLFVYACERVCDCKEKLLPLKEKLGFNDKFAFMEDNSFMGFSIKDGRLIREDGVTDEAIFAICDKWFYGFPATANHYQYEVANYVIALAETDKYGKYFRYPRDFLEKLGYDLSGEDA